MTKTVFSIRHVIAAGSLALGSCASAPPLHSPPPDLVSKQVFTTGLKDAPVNVGDVFVYDNPPMRWEVTGIGSDYIDWSNGSDGFQKTTWSTLLPALRWHTAGNAGVRELKHVAGTLHPLKKGNKVTFIEDTLRSRPGTAFSGTWECEVQGEVELVVKAGKSQTWQVLCKIDGREKILFNYAEAIGNAVRIIVAEADGTTTITQLVDYKSGSTDSTEQ